MNWQGLIILHLHKQKQKQPQAILPTVAHNHAPVTTTHRRFTRHPVAMSPPHKTPDHMPHANKPLPSSPLLSFPGYGILFFHQLGILKYLENQFDLSACSFVGSSAGSSLSVFAANGVDPQSALDLAHALCIKHGVFQRPLGLMGVWGGIVREWLDILLPDDAADRCNGRVQIVITTLPLFQREVVSDFKDRADLIDCCLASSHVPFLMDWRAAAVCRGRRCVDGSMLYILSGRCHGLRPLDKLSSLLLFDPWRDQQLLRGGWSVLRCVLLCGREGAQQLLDKGFAHAKTLDGSGGLTKTLGPYRKAAVGVAGVVPGVMKGESSETATEVSATAATAEVAVPVGVIDSLFVGGTADVVGCAGLSSSTNHSLCSFQEDAVAVIASAPEGTCCK